MSQLSVRPVAPPFVGSVALCLLAACGADSDGWPPETTDEPVTASAQELQACATLYPTDDTYISSAAPGSNYDSDIRLLVGQGPSSSRQALLRFDVPTGVNVVSATLNLREAEANATSAGTVHAVTASWDEATVTYSSFGGAYVAAPAGSFTNSSTDAELFIDVTTLAQDWSNGVYANHGLLLAGTSGQTRVGSMANVPQRRPTMTVCYDQPTAPKTVFTTSSLYNGNLGGLAGADAICQAHADGAGLTGTYKAFLSSSTVDVDDRMIHSSGPYKLVDGTVIAADWSWFAHGSSHYSLALGAYLPINLTELGTTPPTTTVCGTAAVWTNTWEYLGGIAETDPDWTCQDFTLGAGGHGAPRGKWSSGYLDWSYSCLGGTCDALAALYCVEQ